MTELRILAKSYLAPDNKTRPYTIDVVELKKGDVITEVIPATAIYVERANVLPTEDGIYYTKDDEMLRLAQGDWDDGWGNPADEKMLVRSLPLRKIADLPDD